MKSLKEVLDICNANGEEGLETLFRIMEPEDDRDEMGTVFEDTIGYNPITYYDEKDIDALIEDVTEESIREMIKERHDEIVEETLKNHRESIVDDFANAVITVLGIESVQIGDYCTSNLVKNDEEYDAEDLEEDDEE